MRFIKRSVSILLASLMAFAQPLYTFADTLDTDPIYIGGERLSNVPEDGNYVYMGNSTVQLLEGNGVLSVPIYREGDTAERAWVKIHTIDLTSVYGRDYRVEGKHKTEHAGMKNIFQLIAEGNADTTEIKQYEIDVDGVQTPGELSYDAVSQGLDEETEGTLDGDLAAGDEGALDDGFAVDEGVSLDDAYSVEDEASATNNKNTAVDTSTTAAKPADNTNQGSSTSNSSDSSNSGDNAAEGDDIDLNSLTIKGVKETGSTSVNTAELAAEYAEYAAQQEKLQQEKLQQEAADSTGDITDNGSGSGSSSNLNSSSGSDSSKVIIAPANAKPKATPDEYAEDYEPQETEIISQKAVVDGEPEESSTTSGISALAKLKYEQTGVPTREGVPVTNLNSSFTDQLLGAIMPEYMSLISYSCEQTIYFEPGEDEAQFVFRTYDNAGSDGSRMFSVIITETSDNVEPYKATNMTVVIEDDEETSHSKLSFSSDSYEAEDDKVQIKIEREGLLQTMATAVLTASNTESDEAQVLGELVFTPYETEKTVDLRMSHDAVLSLTEFVSADEGDIAVASVKGTSNSEGDYEVSVISDSELSAQSEESEAMLLSSSDEAVALADSSSTSSTSSSETRKFNITINSHQYEVRYSKGDLKGKIWDTSYKPELEVGEYLFSTDDNNGGYFSYRPLHMEGDTPSYGGTYDADYLINDADKSEQLWQNGHGRVRYYAPRFWYEGRIRIEQVRNDANKPSPLNALYYQYAVPDIEEYEKVGIWGNGEWTSFRIAPKSFYDQGQPSEGVKKYVHHIDGKFGRSLPNGLRVKIENENSLLYSMVSAEDNTASGTPKSYVNFYGIAAMYKMFRINVNSAEEQDFISGDSTVKEVPAQVQVKCGAQEMYDHTARDIYINSDVKQSKLVFSILTNNINGSTDMFGNVTGYKITIGNNPKTQKTVEYPKDFINYISDSKRVSTDAISYTKASVETEIKSINDALNIVPIDIYFVDWINSLTNERIDGTSDNRCLYYQQLSFTPILSKIDVKVQVTAAKLDGQGLKPGLAAFKKSELQEGKTLSFHAGDKLDLSAECKDSKYTVVGYEVSVDGGVNFNQITDSSTLTLSSGYTKGYIIRPLVAAGTNYLEIKYDAAANGRVHVSNVVPQSALEKYPDLKGRVFIDVNPKATDIYERIKPVVGKAYSVDIIVDNETDNGKAVRPTVTDASTGKTYNTNKYYFVARNTKEHNLFTVGVQFSDPKSLHDYTLTGSVVTKSETVRHDGLTPAATPAVGYNAEIGAGQTKVKDTTMVASSGAAINTDGSFTLNGKAAASNDLITMLCTNGYNDSQVLEVKLGINEDKSGKYVDNAGQLVISYPYGAPKITSVTYNYDKSDSKAKVNLTENGIKCFDDTLTLTATVDNKGRNIEEVAFVVRNTNNDDKVYHAKAKDTGSNNVFEVKIDNMLNRLHNGDRIFAYIVDKEKKNISGIDSGQITYPTVNTGLYLLVENEKVAPKDFNIDSKFEQGDKTNIPIIGAPATNIKSGQLSFVKTDYPSGKGYSYSVNLSLVLKDRVEYTTTEARKKKLEQVSGLLQKERQERAKQLDALEKKEEPKLNNDLLGGEDNITNNLLEEDVLSDQSKSESLVEHTDGSEALAELNGGYPHITAEILFLMNFEFVLNEANGEYMLAQWAATVGGKVGFIHNRYTLLWGTIPAFVSFSGSVQISFFFGAVTDDFKNGMSQGVFDKTQGNLKQVAEGSKYLYGTDVVCMFRVQLGVGICDVLSARGGITVDFQAQLGQYGGAADSIWGLYLGAKGTIGFDLLITTMDFTFAGIGGGWGNFKDKTHAEWFGHETKLGDAAKKTSAASANTLSLSAEDEGIAAYSDEADADSNEEYTLRAYGVGSDVDSFGEDEESSGRGLLRMAPEVKEKQTLLKDAAERTRSKLISLDKKTGKDSDVAGGKKYMVLFLGKGEDSETHKDTTLLYYSVTTDGGSTWSKAELVDKEDCHYDTSPDVIDMGNNKYFVAWLDARNPIDTSEEAEDFKKPYNSFDVSGAIFDFGSGDEPTIDKFTLETDTKRDGVTVGEDKYFFNVAPKLTKVGSQIYCSYIKRDIHNAKTKQDLTDMQSLYSTVAYVYYDFNAEEGKEISEEKFFNQHWDGYPADPLIIGYDVAGFTAASTDGFTDSNYLTVVYTLDGDSTLSTADDRNMYLAVYNMTEKLAYYPIKITSDTRAQTLTQINNLNNTLYLTWVEHGEELNDSRFSIMNITDTVQTLLRQKGISERFSPNLKSTYGSTTGSEGSGTQTISQLSDDNALERRLAAAGRTKAKATPGELEEEAVEEDESISNEETKVIKETVDDVLNSDNKVLFTALKSASNAFNVYSSGSADPYNSSGWKDLGDGWLMSGNDWYKIGQDDAELKSGLIDFYKSESGHSEYDETQYADDYSNFVIGRLNEYRPQIFTAYLSNMHSGTYSNINEYQLMGDGEKYIYVFFNDYCDDLTHAGKELWAMRFTETGVNLGKDGKENEGNEPVEATPTEYSTQPEDIHEMAGFSEPILLTDYNLTMDEFDVEAGASQGAIKAVSNMYDPSTGKNDLVFLNFQAAGSVKPIESSIDISNHLTLGEKSELSFSLKNQGLYVAKGCEVEVELLNEDDEVLQTIAVPDDVKEYLDSLVLEPGQTAEVALPWTPDKDIKDTKIRITATEKKSSWLDFSTKSYSAEASVPYKPVVEIEDYELDFDGRRMNVTATVANHGSADISELTMVLSNLGVRYEDNKEVGKSYLSGGLKSGEEKEVSFTFLADVDDFNELERIRFELTAVGDGDELKSDYLSYTSSTPVICEIEDGLDTIYISSGSTRKLNYKAAPYNELAGTPMFDSSDPTIAYVDADGELHALKAGSVVITMFYPSLDIYDTIRINVDPADTSTRNSDRYKDGSGTGTISVGGGVISRGVTGDWSYHPESGKWTFVSGNRQYKSEWAYIYNPYAAGTANEYDWFRFDDAGYMVTGWFDDIDGNRYFLWPLSDTRMGHMVTGWQQIGLKWYFLKTVSDGTRGALMRNTTTPDGYKVDADGVWVE